ncbi:hypothetical protein BC940DRAFT_137784 [Gongronella butleri]|nr:hypothetical protein BC940DRAFT_137784 [Gongronella butleri]
MTEYDLSSDRRTKRDELVDPSCLFDPALLSPGQRPGFHLLFPNWHKTTVLDRPTIGEMRIMLKDLDLTIISPKSVFIADMALTPSPDTPSSKRDMTLLQEFAFQSCAHSDACSAPAMSSSESKDVRAFQGRHGKVTLQEILGAVQYIKGIISNDQFAPTMVLFHGGLMATRLEDLQFIFEEDEQAVLELSLKKVRRAKTQEEVVAVVTDILSTVKYKQNWLFFNLAGFTRLNRVANMSLKWEFLDPDVFEGEKRSMWRSWSDEDHCLVQNWQTGIAIQAAALCNLIAYGLFGHWILITCKELDMSKTIAETISFSIFGPMNKYNIKFPGRLVTLKELLDKGYRVRFQAQEHFSVKNQKINIAKIGRTDMALMLRLAQRKTQGAPCPINDMIHIYSGLIDTLESFKLAIELGITDYEDFGDLKNDFEYFEEYCCFDEVVSEHGYNYALLCRDFYSWRQRIKRDFTNSLTRDAFAVLVTAAALIVSFSGIIQVVQGFTSK